jgi:hypothetical protein
VSIAPAAVDERSGAAAASAGLAPKLSVSVVSDFLAHEARNIASDKTITELRKYRGAPVVMMKRLL